MQSEKNVDLELMFTEETKKDWCLCTDQQYISWLEKKLIEKLTVKPSSLHVKEKSTPTFEGFLNSLGKKEWNGEYIYLYDGRFITKQRASEIYKEKYKL